MSRQKQFASRIYQAGLNIGLPEHLARLAATQASLETGYGKSVKGNNYFGIKAGSSWGGDTQEFTTHEEYGGKKVKIRDKFRKYDTPEESLKDWAALMQRAYPRTWSSQNFDQAVDGLQKGKYGAYATDSKYSSKLNYIDRNFIEPSSQRPVVALADAPPPRPTFQEPSTALAAIEQIAPPLPRPVPANAYAPTPNSRNASILDKISALNNAKQFERGEPNKFSDMGYGVKRVADAVGGTFLNAGKGLADSAMKMASLPDPVNLPRPRPQRDPRFDFSGLDNVAPPELQMAVDMKAASIGNPITPPTPIGLPRPRPEYGHVPAPKIEGQEVTSPLLPPTPIAPPVGLQDTINPFAKIKQNVYRAAPSVFNAVHDVRGRVDGMKEAVRQRFENDLTRALGNRPSTYSNSLPSGYQLGTNGYIYGKNRNTNRFEQVGKREGDRNRLYDNVDLNRKPKRVWVDHENRWELR